VGDFITGFVYVVETQVGLGHRIVRRYYWHCTFGTGCITSSGFMLQPNIQECDFGRYVPMLEGLDPSTVHQWYIDFCQVGHDYGIYVPAHEEF